MLHHLWEGGGAASDDMHLFESYGPWLCDHQAKTFFGLPGGGGEGGLPPAGHTQHSQANPTAGGPRQSLTSEIRLTPLSQEVPSARTKNVWELNPHAKPCHTRQHPGPTRTVLSARGQLIPPPVSCKRTAMEKICCPCSAGPFLPNTSTFRTRNKLRVAAFPHRCRVGKPSALRYVTSASRYVSRHILELPC